MANVIVPADDWTPGSPIYYQLSFENQVYNVYNGGSGYTFNAANTWAVTSPIADSIRFEVRSGDTNWFDVGSGKERSEIGTTATYDYHTPIHISYQFELEPGARNTATWMDLGQVHQTSPQTTNEQFPMFAFTLNGETLGADIRYVDGSGNLVLKHFVLDPYDITRGQTYNMEVYANFSDDANGHIVVVRDGEVLLDYKGPVGYTSDGSVYWQYGVYRSHAAETIAADYSDVKIDSGDAVQMPADGSSHSGSAPAPTLGLAGSGPSGDGGTATLSGLAPAGSTVQLFDGSKLVASATADGDGRYSMALPLAQGLHLFRSASLDADGKLSATSNQVLVDVDTAANVLHNMGYLASAPGLAAVVLTDTHTLTVSSLAEMTSIIAGSANVLAMIDGGVNFLFQSGTADNRTSTYYDMYGTRTDAVTDTTTNGVLTRETHEYFTPGAAIEKEVVQYGIAGKSYVSTYQAFNAAGTMIESNRYHADGSLDYHAVTAANGTQTVDSYDATGKLLSHNIIHAQGDGSAYAQELTAYVTGQAYVSSYQAIDWTGKVVYSSHSYADGTLQYDQKLTADGSSLSHTYATDGSLLTTSTIGTDGTSVTQTYSAGKLATTATTYADKSSEIDNWVDGAIVTKVLVHATGTITKEVYNYGVTGQTYTSQYQAYQGTRLVTTERYHANGSLDYSSYTLADGGTDVRRFDASGTIVSDTITHADKSTDISNYTNGILTKETIAYATAAADGTAKLVYEYNVTGLSYTTRVVAYDASGKMLGLAYPGVAQDGAAPNLAVTASTLSSATIPADSALHIIVGSHADDTLTGTAGNDRIDGGTGDDMMQGGAGNDTYFVDSAHDNVVELAGGGTDTVNTSLAHYTLSDNVEQLAFIGAGDATLTGNVLDNVITGGDGNDTLNGGAGIDHLYGGDGNDTYIVDDPNDVVIEAANGGDDLVSAYSDYTLSANVERLTLQGSANLNGTGNELDNLITGNSGNNRLDGGDGNDTLLGGAGNDTLLGGAGSDTLRGGDGNDVLTGGQGTDQLQGGAGADRFVFAAGDTSNSSATADHILDFSPAQGDKIDLSQIDANSLLAGSQHFTFSDDKPVTPVAGSVWLIHTDNFWQVHADTNGDGRDDLVIRVDVPTGELLHASDFLL